MSIQDKFKGSRRQVIKILVVDEGSTFCWESKSGRSESSIGIQ